MLEEEVQRRLVADLRRAGRVLVAHVPNGGVATPGYRRKLAGLGLCKGFPDLVLVGDGWTGGLELKAKTGSLRPDQRRVLADLAARGWRIAVARGLDAARGVCFEWGALDPADIRR